MKRCFRDCFKVYSLPPGDPLRERKVSYIKRKLMYRIDTWGDQWQTQVDRSTILFNLKLSVFTY